MATGLYLEAPDSLLHRSQLMCQYQMAPQRGVGIHRRRILDQVHDSSQHVEAHGAHGMGEPVPLAGDVGHLELQVGGGKPGVRSLGPKLTQLDPAYPRLLLLLLLLSTTTTTAPTRLLEVLVISNGSQHL